MDADLVFRALSDPSRRQLLDQLFERDGRTLSELESGLDMTRFGVMKHLRVLEAAGLIATRKVGREKLHYLNRMPIQLIYDRWIGKFAAERVSALADLKQALEGDTEVTVVTQAKPTQIYEVFIKATPQRVWEAITNSQFTTRYFFGKVIQSDLKAGSSIRYATPDTSETVIEGEVLESDPPHKLVYTWHCTYSPDVIVDRPSRVTWELAAEGDGVTKLTVVHDDFDGETVTFHESAAGWTRVLSGLKTFIETGQELGVA